MHDLSTDGVLLLGPGPSPVGHAVRSALAAPVLGHLDPAFLALMDRVQAGLRDLFGTDNPMTLPLSGTGSAGMEAVLTNLVEPGDRVVVGVHGIFGARIADLARRLGGEVVAVEAEFGTALDPQAVAGAVAAGDTAILAVVHAETSTGVLQPLPDLAAIARETGALLVLDCVTSLGGVELSCDRLGVDAAFAGTQKCLSVPPGLAPATFSERALDKARRRAGPVPSWYFDLGLLQGYWGSERVYHHTAPVSMVYGLAAALEEIRSEGMAAREARHRAVAQALYRGLAALGLRCLVEEGLRTPMLTSVCIPEGVDDRQARACLRHRHGIEIGGGLGPLAGRIWRIGLMGHGARQQSVVRVLQGLADVLAAAGRQVDLPAALAAAGAAAGDQ